MVFLDLQLGVLIHRDQVVEIHQQLLDVAMSALVHIDPYLEIGVQHFLYELRQVRQRVNSLFQSYLQKLDQGEEQHDDYRNNDSGVYGSASYEHLF